MKNLSLPVTLLLLAAPGLRAEEAGAILARVDRNLSARTRVVESTMTIHGRRGSRTLTAKSYAEGTRKAFTEYLSPAADEGTKMLKLSGQMWIYSPASDRILIISGHLLRQSVMGSDLSYEDLMDDRKLEEIYTGRVTGEEEIAGRPAWVLELTAKVTDAAYPRQKLWIDRERDVPLRQELYAKSGKQLKEVTFTEVQRVAGRWYPMKMLYKDLFKQGQGTEVIIHKIAFDQVIPDWIFSKAALKR
ncbi:MAG TPA: outer membrane lipoprotein-sorting protein [bacterium]|nr:outer membrane lipoprotein-sorting protein [bacterium]HQG47260.1 outer membrane lipoprotein-sorting protein [bacterium]HQI48611.1 outer membrane lipoprotein-sorting protein [bacterium]HQJ63961.1 outer membrane lipoprotein-sorting protein [bacterium]